MTARTVGRDTDVAATLSRPDRRSRVRSQPQIKLIKQNNDSRAKRGAGMSPRNAGAIRANDKRAARFSAAMCELAAATIQEEGKRKTK